MKNHSTTFIIILSVLVCSGLLSRAQAQEGDIGNENTNEGFNALSAVISGGGVANTGLGWFSAAFTSSGSFNTAVGAGSLDLNTTGTSNTAIGTAALLLNGTNSNNTAVGVDALLNNAADGNTATGFFALQANTTGGTVATGVLGAFNVGPNVAVGSHALQNNLDGSADTAVGHNALFSQVHGFALGGAPNFSANTAVGFGTLFNLTGSAAGDNAVNTALGYQALNALTDGDSNVAIGAHAGFSATGGTSLTSGDGNIFIGAFVTPASSTESGNTYIGNIAFTTQPFGGTVGNVTIDTFGGAFPQRLGIDTSSRRYKEDIKPMDKLSEMVFKLKPVSYRIKKEINPTQPTAFGLIAEDVEEANPDLVLHNAKGQPEGVHYQMVNVMLLNEFLKEHKKVEEQQASISQLKSEMQTMVAQLKEQAEQIQKVSAQLEVNKPAPQVVTNKP